MKSFKIITHSKNSTCDCGKSFTGSQRTVDKLMSLHAKRCPHSAGGVNTTSTLLDNMSNRNNPKIINKNINLYDFIQQQEIVCV